MAVVIADQAKKVYGCSFSMVGSAAAPTAPDSLAFLTA